MFNLNEKILFSDSVVSYSFYAKCFVCDYFIVDWTDCFACASGKKQNVLIGLQ